MIKIFKRPEPPLKDKSKYIELRFPNYYPNDARDIQGIMINGYVIEGYDGTVALVND